MRWTLPLSLGLAATCSAANNVGDSTGMIAPRDQPPEGCQPMADGPFQVSVLPLGEEKRSVMQKRSCESDKTLVMTLDKTVLTDAKKRTGYIASNFQFQFDDPPQHNALLTAGFSLCGNGSLALGSSTVFYRCLSGSFYNLYDRDWAAQCEAIEMLAMPCAGAAAGKTIPICQIGDGQVQAHTTPCAEAPPAVTEVPVVSQIDDGQPQAPTFVPGLPVVSQIEDGQPQAPTAVPELPVVSQIDDGQPQAPTLIATPSAPDFEVPVTGVPGPSVPQETDLVSEPLFTAAPTPIASIVPFSSVPFSSVPFSSVPELATSLSGDASPSAATKISEGQPEVPNAEPGASSLPVGAGADRSLPVAVTSLVVAIVGAIVFLY